MEKEKLLFDFGCGTNLSRYKSPRKAGPVGLLLTVVSTFLILTIENKVGFVKTGISDGWNNILIILTTTELLIVLVWSAFSAAPKMKGEIFSKKWHICDY